MNGLRQPWGLNMVNQAFRIKIAYRSEKKKEEEEENTRDRSVPDGSDKNIFFALTSKYWSQALSIFSRLVLPSGFGRSMEHSRAPIQLSQPLQLRPLDTSKFRQMIEQLFSSLLFHHILYTFSTKSWTCSSRYGGTIYGFLFTSDMCSAALVSYPWWMILRNSINVFEIVSSATADE